MAVWRLQTKTDGGRIGQFCLDKGIAAVGWSLLNVAQSEREKIQNYSQFVTYAECAYSGFGSVNRLQEVRAGDFIWIRHEGRYYMGHVSKDSHWQFDSSEEAARMDAANQLTNIRWIRFAQADESTVPGAISTAFIKGSTLQRINKPGVDEFSKLLYNREMGKRIYDVQFELTEPNFYSMLSPSDCEDLLCMWLYAKYGYICIPSTNKLATQLYECVLLDPKTGEHIYIQVKNGNVEIDADDYKQLQGVTWLFTTKGRVINAEKHNHMKVADPCELYDFAISDESVHILPPSIKAWVNFLEEDEYQKAGEQKKGIIFDTNKSYDITSQDHMISQNRVSAWGDACRFIDRFNPGDYVLYYEKGKGIIAVAKITSEAPLVYGSEKYQTVSMIVPPDDNRSIRPSELKKLLKKGFYFASTVKAPYLSEDEVFAVCEALKRK